MTSKDIPGAGKGGPRPPGESEGRAEAILRQRALGRQLREIYNGIADEPLPDDLLALVESLPDEPPPDPDAPEGGAR